MNLFVCVSMSSKSSFIKKNLFFVSFSFSKFHLIFFSLLFFSKSISPLFFKASKSALLYIKQIFNNFSIFNVNWSNILSSVLFSHNFILFSTLFNIFIFVFVLKFSLYCLSFSLISLILFPIFFISK